MSDPDPVSAPVPDAPPDAASAASPEGSRRRDTSGLNRGPADNEKRARERLRRALRLARAYIADFPPEMARVRSVQDLVKDLAFLRGTFDEVKRLVLRQSPVTRAGEIKESVKVALDLFDRLQGSTEALLKLWPHAPAPVDHRAVFSYEDPLEVPETAEQGAAEEVEKAPEPEAPAPEVHRPPTAETVTVDDAPPPVLVLPPNRRPLAGPSDMSRLLGWLTLSGTEDDDDVE